MPPRKSDAAKVAAADEVSSTPSKDPKDGKDLKDKDKDKEKEKDGINVEDLNLPKSIVTRLAKGILPPNTQVQGNAILAMQKSATVFVNYLTTTANEYAQTANRKTIAPADVFTALDDLEFSDFRPRLEAELAKFNEIQSEKRTTYRKRVAADKALGLRGSDSAESGTLVGGGIGEGIGNGEGDGDRERVAKKPRLEEGAEGGEDALGEEELMAEEEIEQEEAMRAEEEGYEDDQVAESEEEGAGEEEGWREKGDEEGVGGEVEDEALDDGGDSD